MDIRVCPSDLFLSERPSHWPTSSFYSAKTALRKFRSTLPKQIWRSSIRLSKLGALIDSHLKAGANNQKRYKSRILRLAAEKGYGKILGRGETKRLLEDLN